MSNDHNFHMFNYINYGLAYTHSTATEQGLDEKIAAHEDQARSQTQGKVTRSTDSTAS
jgi:hypothetical protein